MSVYVMIGGPVRTMWMSDDGSEEREITDIKTIKRFHGEKKHSLLTANHRLCTSQTISLMGLPMNFWKE